MRTVFIILPFGKAGLMEADELERTLQFMFRRREVTHTSRAYWDDTQDGTEYGVRLDIYDLTDAQFERLLGEVVIVTARLYGSIVIQMSE